MFPTLQSMRVRAMKKGMPLPIWTACETCGKGIQMKYNAFQRNLDKETFKEKGFTRLWEAYVKENAEVEDMKNRGMM